VLSPQGGRAALLSRLREHGLALGERQARGTLSLRNECFEAYSSPQELAGALAKAHRGGAAPGPRAVGSSAGDAAPD